MACNFLLDTSVVGLGAWVSAGLGGPVEGSGGSLAVSLASFSPSSSTGLRVTSRWFLACEAVRGHSTGVVVDSLGGPGRVPSRRAQCSSRGSGVGAWDMIWDFGVCRGF